MWLCYDTESLFVVSDKNTIHEVESEDEDHQDYTELFGTEFDIGQQVV